MAKYVKRPEVINAIQYKGFEELEEVKEFMGDDFHNVLFRPLTEELILNNFSDERVNVKMGNYIIKDFKLGYLVVGEAEFEHRYQEVN